MPQLISISEASSMSERDVTTIRRWVRAGKLTAHVGPVAARGGRASTLIDRVELMSHLVISGAQPREIEKLSNENDDLVTKGHSRSVGDRTIFSAELEAAELRGRLVAAEALRDVARLTAEGDGLRRQAEDLRVQVESERRRADELHAELRSDLMDSRDHIKALRAELSALRALGGGSWWTRLLGGPVAAIAE